MRCSACLLIATPVANWRFQGKVIFLRLANDTKLNTSKCIHVHQNCASSSLCFYPFHPYIQLNKLHFMVILLQFVGKKISFEIFDLNQKKMLMVKISLEKNSERKKLNFKQREIRALSLSRWCCLNLNIHASVCLLSMENFQKVAHVNCTPALKVFVKMHSNAIGWLRIYNGNEWNWATFGDAHFQ